ncbi:APC family permease [Dasania marina]|uniref:APC family permease n=1 Tax=Dasania marina TaxID=471499 RepID=UPI000360F146|nr:APC family permease [Dasania marina]
MDSVIHHIKSLRLRDLTLFTVSAILLLDTLAAAAAVGASSIFWWLFLGIIFFIPFGLISAEMGTTYPEQGGIYAWVRDSFGGRWASRATWGYWVNTALWNPAIFILFAAVFSQLFIPDLALKWQIVLGIALSWIAVAINIITLEVGKWIPNIGAILKVVIFIAVIVGGLAYSQDHGMANQITFETLKPNWGEGMQYIPVIIYGMLGFELMCAGSDEIHEPAKNVPKAVLFSGLIIISLYTLGTAAILVAIPAQEINLVEGLMNTLYLFFGGSVWGDAFALCLGVAALFTFFSNGVTWSLGCNRAIAEAANEGEFPAFLGYEHKVLGTPVGAAITMGCVSTCVLVLYGLMAGSSEDLFWSLFSFSAVIALLPYIGMMLAFIKMRVSDGDRPRPFKVAGGMAIAGLCACSCIFVLCLSIVLFIYTPNEGMQWAVFIGAIAVLIIGEIVIRSAETRVVKPINAC